MLVFVGVGSIAMDYLTDGTLGLTGIAFAFGLTIAVMVAAVYHVSGAHFNPSVTIALLITGNVGPAKAGAYIAAQIAGAIAGVLILKLCISQPVLDGVEMGVTALGPGITAFQGLIAEIVLTFFLVFVIFGVAVGKRYTNAAPLFIGLTITAAVFVGGPISGAALNPARYLGPALFGGGLQDFWIYWVGPILGAVLAALLYSKLLAED